MTLIDKLKTIQLKIGNVGADKLYNEAKKQKVEEAAPAVEATSTDEKAPEAKPQGVSE